ncbi:MAG: hypothetical protein SGI74_10040 [Oligoflexia bacterium]|nr:hypothetical protein [Oligoflexia bacterium]
MFFLNLKKIVPVVAIIIVANTSYGATRKIPNVLRPITQQKTSLSEQELLKDTTKSSYVDFQVSSGTIVARNTVYSGYQTSFLSLQAGYGAYLKNDWEASAQLPMTWLSDENNNQDRIIGRPHINISKSLMLEKTVKLIGGFGMKLPLYDTSFGKSELYRAWEFAPRIGVNVTFNNPANSFFANGSIAYNTDTKYTYGTYNENTASSAVIERSIDHPLLLRSVAGLLHESQSYTVGIGARIIPTLNAGSEKSSSTAQGSNPEKHETKQLTSWLVEVFGSYELIESVNLKAGVSKSLRTEFDNTRPNLIAHDNFSDIADLAFNLGVVQSF